MRWPQGHAGRKCAGQDGKSHKRSGRGGGGGARRAARRPQRRRDASESERAPQANDTTRRDDRQSTTTDSAPQGTPTENAPRRATRGAEGTRCGASDAARGGGRDTRRGTQRGKTNLPPEAHGATAEREDAETREDVTIFNRARGAGAARNRRRHGHLGRPRNHLGGNRRAADGRKDTETPTPTNQQQTTPQTAARNPHPRPRQHAERAYGGAPQGAQRAPRRGWFFVFVCGVVRGRKAKTPAPRGKGSGGEVRRGGRSGDTHRPPRRNQGPNPR